MSSLDNLLDLSGSSTDDVVTAIPAAPDTSFGPNTPIASATTAPTGARRVTGYQPRRVGQHAPAILGPKDPTVTLTRLQSGIGTLTIEAACSAEVGDLRLGCAYQLRSGVSSVVQYASGVTTAPPQSSRAVILGSRGQYERITLDLIQSREIERLVIYAFPGDGRPLNWGGTLVVTTFGQDQIEFPLDRPPSDDVRVLLSLYNIRGEFVIRAEMESFPGPVRGAVAGYGFDRVAWLDQRTPLV